VTADAGTLDTASGNTGVGDTGSGKAADWISHTTFICTNQAVLTAFRTAQATAFGWGAGNGTAAG
jgi:hypothetical protein